MSNRPSNDYICKQEKKESKKKEGIGVPLASLLKIEIYVLILGA
jgi:hypothetical protein